jgi:hypothetical protein
MPDYAVSSAPIVAIVALRVGPFGMIDLKYLVQAG